MRVLSEDRGDYDGDVMEAFWQPTLVQKFRPADKEFADEPAELAGRLKVDTESVQEFGCGGGYPVCWWTGHADGVGKRDERRRLKVTLFAAGTA